MIPLLYIEPNLIALLFQGLVGAVIIGLATIKMWWSRVSDIIAGLFTSRPKSK